MAQPILVVGSVALDDIRTPFGAVQEAFGGSASYFSLAARFFAPVRVVAVVGEGGSGGALGIGVGNRVLILENAYYSVITPEGCAAILWRDAAAQRSRQSGGGGGSGRSQWSRHSSRAAWAMLSHSSGVSPLSRQAVRITSARTWQASSQVMGIGIGPGP